MGPAHCTSGAIYCSEISSTLAWGRKVPSLHGVPRGGSTRVLTVERLLYQQGRLTHSAPFSPPRGSYLAVVAESKSVSCKHYALPTSLEHLTHHTALRLRNHTPHTPQRIILKLKSHGIGISIINWIEQWLSDRRQRVVDGIGILFI